MIDEERLHNQELLEIHLFAIRKLEETEARYGPLTPTHILIELEERRRAVIVLKSKLPGGASIPVESLTWESILNLSQKQVDYQIRVFIGSKYDPALYISRDAEASINGFIEYRFNAARRLDLIMDQLAESLSAETDITPKIASIREHISKSRFENALTELFELRDLTPASSLQEILRKLERASERLESGNIEQTYDLLTEVFEQLLSFSSNIPEFADLENLLQNPILTRDDAFVIAKLARSVTDLIRTEPQSLNLSLAISILQKSPRNLYIVIDKAGSGKTNMFCKLATEQSTKRPTVLLTGTQLKDVSSSYSIEKAILAAMQGLASERDISSTVQSQAMTKLPENLVEKICEICIEKDEELVIFLDGINSVRDPDRFVDAVLDFLSRYHKSRIRICMSCRDVYWGYFHEQSWQHYLSDKLEGELQQFSPSEYLDASSHYFETYGVRVKLSGNALDRLKHPLVLKLFCEAYGDEAKSRQTNLGELNDLRLRDLLQLYWNTKISSIKEAIGLRTTEPVERFLLHVANRMLETEVVNLPKIELKTVLPAEDLDAPNSIYVQCLDEGLLRESSSSPGWLEPELSFMYEELLEYAIARTFLARFLSTHDALSLQPISSYIEA